MDEESHIMQVLQSWSLTVIYIADKSLLESIKGYNPVGTVVYRIQSLVEVRTPLDKTKFGDGNLDKFENKFFNSLDF